MITVTYVLVCSTLADQVQREHDEGIVGPAYWRTPTSARLHLVVWSSSCRRCRR